MAPVIEDRTPMLASAIEQATEGDLERLEGRIEPVSVEDACLSPLELRQKYGATADLTKLYALRGLRPEAALLEFIG